MTLRILEELGQGSEEWHAQRRGMVTASVVGQLIAPRSLAAIDFACPSCAAPPHNPCRGKAKRVGLEGEPIKSLHPARAEFARKCPMPPVLEPARNDTARGLTALLTAERITDYTELTYVNDDMLRGIEDEPRAVELYAETYAPVSTVGFMVRDEWGFQIGYSPDGLVGDDGLIEVKSRRQKKHLQTILNDAVPPENMAQLQTGLLVSGRDWIDYLSYCGGMPMYRKRVLPDPRWHQAIVAAVELFEANAAEHIAKYAQSIEGLPATERVVEMEMSI